MLTKLELSAADRASRLRACLWSEALSDDVVAALGARMSAYAAAPGDALVDEADGSAWFGVIVAGEAEVTQSFVAGERVLRVMGPGRAFGELALVDGSPRSASIEALSELTFLVLTPGQLDTMVAEDPATAFAFMRRIAGTLAQRIRMVERNRY